MSGLTVMRKSGDVGGISTLQGWLRALELTKPIAANPARTLAVIVEELAAKFGDAPALLSERESLSFRALAQRLNRYARWALAQGIRKGDVVCLLMRNRPEYMAIWLGITRIGGVVALINTNLVGSSLAHCINVVAPRHIIFSDDMGETFAAIRSDISDGVQIWSHGGRAHRDVARDLDDYCGEHLMEAECALPLISDRALLIYTSGTTGLPKAANVNHYRLLIWSLWFAGMMDTRASDRMYNCLPMYHSIGGVVATGAVIVNGGSVVIREKFSAREFWDDLTRWDCTLFQYIGELCRYLLHAPPQLAERGHRIRLACGNGLRADVWEEFKERFQIPQIIEFYAATEGNVTLFNAEGKPGAIGRIPSFLAHRSPIALVKYDSERDEIVRDERGYCIRCGANEPGEAIGKILAGTANIGSRFEGYTDPSASAKKIIRDVFETGDAWFRTGDLMRKDTAGFYYFVDRLGDTFRWKGENVSTAEVAEAVASFRGVLDASVYGVTVPGTEGKAGMAAVVAVPDLDLAGLRAHLVRRLPDYARPLFLRLRGRIDVTETFKHRKSELVRDGFDPAASSDAIYFDDREQRAFVPLDRKLHALICRGSIRL